jgi:hypothetical protein
MHATVSRTPPQSGPVQVGLTVPGSSGAAPAMEEMRMEE